LPLAVIVGAGGIAMAIARRLGHGYRLLVADRDRTHLERQVDELQREGHNASGVPCDVSDAADVVALANAAASRGPVRALIHVVGLSPSMADGPTILEVNLAGPTRVADAFVALAETGTAAVFISSMAGHSVSVTAHLEELLTDPLAPGFASSISTAVGGELAPAHAYQLSKYALIAMCRHRAPEWGRRGARIMSLSPGLIDSPMGTREHEANPQKSEMLAWIPLNREGTMIEIAEATEFLVSDRASYITGTDLLVDGGISAAMRAQPRPRAAR
jgi:NAD(P)-dependent dehydrogenase (short-subunit alcohol dehydrogenase family)